MGIAADTYAQITREMFDNWYQMIYPKQKELMDKASDGTLINEQLARADKNLASSQQAAELGLSNQSARFGVDSAKDDSLAGRSALSLAGAKNAVREHGAQQSMDIISGAGLGVREKMNVGGL